MASKRQIAQSLEEHIGPIVTIAKLSEYCGMSPKWCRRLLENVPPVGFKSDTCKVYFYEDVAEKLFGHR